jgi:phage terminase small subunit
MERYKGTMELTPQQEKFARGCVELANQSAAYRQAYNCEGANFRTIGTEASRTANLPHVAARIRELQEAAVAQTAIPSLAVRIRELRELEQADPNELIAMKWGACRHCYGINHGYQWADEMEYAQAVDLAIKSKTAHPDMSGGFEFNPTKEPVADCPRCWGVGEQRPYIADTTKLSGGARRLYKGIKLKGNGDIEILMHDQMQARDMLNRIQGAYKDGANPATAPAAEAAKAQEIRSPEERQRAYLRVVSG